VTSIKLYEIGDLVWFLDYESGEVIQATVLVAERRRVETEALGVIEAWIYHLEFVNSNGKTGICDSSCLAPRI
jgi:hypothetical protein